MRAALAGGPGGDSQPGMQDLVNAILQLGHLPSQSNRSSAEERRLAVRLIKARKAGTLSCQQEAQLGALQPATRESLTRQTLGVFEPADAGASAGACSQAQGSANVVRVDAGSGASQPAAAAGAGEPAAEGTPAARRSPADQIIQEIRQLGHTPQGIC